MSRSLPLTEDQEQILLAEYLRLKKIRFTASANGGFRNPREASKLKRMGVSPGFPDICIPIRNSRYYGLYIELKRKKGGKLSDHQMVWLKNLSEEGYCAMVCKGFEEAKKVVDEYLKER